MQFSPLHSWSWDKLLTFSTSHGHEVYETVLDIQIRSDIHASRALRLKSNLFVKSLNFELHILSHNSGKYWPILYFLVSFFKFGSRESQPAQIQPPQITGSGPNGSPKIGRKTANFQTLNGWRKFRNQLTELEMVWEVLDCCYVNEKLMSKIFFRPL